MLTKEIGLHRSAVGDLIAELTELGFVQEERSTSNGAPGRPSPEAHPRATVNVVFAVEVLVESISVAAVGLGGRVIESARLDRARPISSPKRTATDIARLMRRVQAKLDPGARVFAVGLAVPGLVRQSDRTVVMAPNLGWVDAPIASLLAERIDLDVPIFVRNEADLGALAESRRGVASGLRDVLYISGEVGVGGGLISDGRLLSGTTGFAGEIGHIPVNPDGDPCNCGSHGCWETEVGEGRLLRRAGLPADGGRPAMAELLEAADNGEAVARQAMDEQGRWLGYGLAGLISIFNPEAVVLGGFLAAAFPYYSTALERELTARVTTSIRSQGRVLPSALGLEAPLLGAAELAWDEILSDPVVAVAAAARSSAASA